MRLDAIQSRANIKLRGDDRHTKSHPLPARHSFVQIGGTEKKERALPALVSACTRGSSTRMKHQLGAVDRKGV